MSTSATATGKAKAAIRALYGISPDDEASRVIYAQAKAGRRPRRAEARTEAAHAALGARRRERLGRARTVVAAAGEDAMSRSLQIIEYLQALRSAASSMGDAFYEKVADQTEDIETVLALLTESERARLDELIEDELR